MTKVKILLGTCLMVLMIGSGTKANASDEIRIGNGAVAKANDYTISIGVRASSNGGIAIGRGAVNNKGVGGVSLGLDAKSLASHTLALGTQAEASGLVSTSIGSGSKARKSSAISLGTAALSNGLSSIAFGHQASSEGDFSTALGYLSKANGKHSIAIGNRALANFFESAALTSGASALGYKSIAIGSGAKAMHSGVTLGIDSFSNDSAFAIGHNVVSNGSGAFTIGTRLTNNKPYSFAVGYEKIALLVDSSGRVGIGTQSPLVSLHIKNGSALIDQNLEAGYIESRKAEISELSSNKGWFRTGLTVGSLDSVSGLYSAKIDADGIETKHLSALNGNFRYGISVDGYSSISTIYSHNIAADQISSNHLSTGPSNKADGQESLAAGRFHVVEANNSTAIGDSNTMLGNGSIAIGKKLTTQAPNSVVIGEGLTNSQSNSFMVGYDSPALFVKSDDNEATNPTIKILKRKIVMANAEIDQLKYTLIKFSPEEPEYRNAQRRITYLNNYIKVQKASLANLGYQIYPRVGVGTISPQQTLHISGAMRLEPQTTAPRNAKGGDMYYDMSGALCVYIEYPATTRSPRSGSWQVVTGRGACRE